MKIRLTCLPEEAPRALQQLDAAFTVDDKSRVDRGNSRGARFYLDVRLLEPEITPEIASHVLAHFGAGGYHPGSFTRDLILLIARADPSRRRRLALAEPAYVLAVSLAQDSADGVETLRAIATGDEVTVQ
jgi:hypothetical protein